jgi:hypothetical protein
MKGRDHTEDLCADCIIIIKWILRKYGGRMCTGFILLRIKPGDGLL